MKYFFPVILLITLFSCNAGRATDEKRIAVTAYSPTVPVFKKLPANPVQRLTVFVPAAQQKFDLAEAHLSLNAAAIDQLSRIDIYMPGTENFSPVNKIAFVNVTGGELIARVETTLLKGNNYIWISAVVKDGVATDMPVEIRCKALREKGGSSLIKINNSTVHPHLVGAAVRKAGEDKVNTYRIPGIVRTNKGTLIAVYDNRYVHSGDLPANVDVGMSRSVDGGQTWQPMKVIMDMGAPHENNGVGDPSILVDPATGRIFVAALWSKGNRSIAGSKPGISPDTTGQFVLATSDDDGLTWSAPYTITPQIKDPQWHLFFDGPGNGIALQDGTLVFPAQYWDENKMPWSTIIYSKDHGASWTGKIKGPKINTTESQVVETSAGTLMLNMRDNRGEYRSIATTNNLGQSWAEHPTSRSALIDPVCQGSIIKAKVKVGGQLKDVLFFSNPQSKSDRVNITVRASLDMGNTWLPENQLLIDQRPSYGYSSLVQLDENTIGILYEGVKELYFVRIPVSKIISSK